MLEQLRGLGESKRWWLMVNAAKRGFEQTGGELKRRPGRGLSNIFDAKNSDGSTDRVSIRTSMDRWLAFPPLSGGKRWKTLDDVNRVLVSTLNDPGDPTTVEVHIFPAAEVRERFKKAYKARTAAGLAVKDNYGMWVGLDRVDRGLATDVGSGLAAEYPPIATFSLASLIAEASGRPVPRERDQELSTASDEPIADQAQRSRIGRHPITIAEVIRDAKESIARIAGIEPDAVKLELKLDI